MGHRTRSEGTAKIQIPVSAGNRSSKPDMVLTGLSRLLDVKTYKTKCNRLVIISKLVIIASQLNIEKHSKLLARIE